MQVLLYVIGGLFRYIWRILWFFLPQAQYRRWLNSSSSCSKHKRHMLWVKTWARLCKWVLPLGRDFLGNWIRWWLHHLFEPWISVYGGWTISNPAHRSHSQPYPRSWVAKPWSAHLWSKGPSLPSHGTSFHLGECPRDRFIYRCGKSTVQLQSSHTFLQYQLCFPLEEEFRFPPLERCIVFCAFSPLAD